jgi:signal transduction histidine kinase
VRPGRRGGGAVELEEIVRAAVHAVARRAPNAACEVRLCFDAPGVQVDADAAALRRALENVIENGIQSMPHGGTLTVATRSTQPSRDVGAGGEGGGQLEITVEDTGIGIPSDQLARVFVPFFTTKEGGTGLGLAIAQKAIAEHDGTIEVSSAAGRGTTFRILLPRRAAGVACEEAR